MRNRSEIIARIETLSPSPIDPFGVMAGLLAFFLDYRDVAGRFVKADVTRDKWNAGKHPRTDERVLLLMYAGCRASWKLANERKGIESNKGFMILETLCWMLGDAHHRWAVDLFWERGKMAHYGKPQLVRMHERFKLGPWQELDDGRWHNTEFGIDLDAAAALRQWEAKWNRTQTGGGNNGRDT